MTNREIALYTLVRLLPQSDAGEFANIGVVLACPQQRRFSFRLIKRYTRVTRFFEEFSGDLFRRVRGEVQAELEHLRKTLLAGAADAGTIAALMNDLARPRESMIRYAPVRTLLTADPAADLERLFRRYVQPDAQDVQQRRDELVERAVRGVLLQQQLRSAFGPEEIGTEDYHVRFPLVHERDGQPVAVIKPLDLTQDEPQKIYEHGGLWVQRIGRLQRLHVLPEGLLIPVDAPPDGDERRAKAFHEVEGELRALGAEVTRPTDAVAIGRFARHYAN
jgi:hypothetical protein